MSFFGSLGSATKNSFENMARARAKRVANGVSSYYVTFDDATLERMGIKREQLKKNGYFNFDL